MSIFTFSPNFINDQSVYVLQQIFGSPIDQIIQHTQITQSATLITNFLGNFDTALSSAFFLIFAIILIVGTLNTAHEGKFLGKQWSSIWVPIRSIIAPIMIFPVKGGFCALQYLLMYLILVGAQIASTVWSSSVNDIEVGLVPNVPSSLSQSINDQLSIAFMYGAVDYVLSGQATGAYAGAVAIPASGSLSNLPISSWVRQAKSDIANDITNRASIPGTGTLDGALINLIANQENTENDFASIFNDNIAYIYLYPILRGNYGNTQNAIEHMCWNLSGGNVFNRDVSPMQPLPAEANPFWVAYDNNGTMGPLSSYFSNQNLSLWNFQQAQNNAPIGSYEGFGFSRCVRGIVGNLMQGNSDAFVQYDDGTANYVLGLGGNWTGNGYSGAGPDGNFDLQYNGTVQYNLNVNPTSPLNGAPNITFGNQSGGYPLNAPGLEQMFANVKANSSQPLNNFFASFVGSNTAVTAPATGSVASPSYGSACSDPNSCNFSGYTDAIIAAISGNNNTAPQTLSQMDVPGTGCTCETFCGNMDGQYYTKVPTDTVTDISVFNPTWDNNTCQNINNTQICNGPNGQPDAGASVFNACVQDTGNKDPVSGNEQYSLITGVDYSESWWYAGEVYLSLAQQMSNNINALARKVSALAVTTSGPPQIIYASGVQPQYYTHVSLIATTDATNPHYYLTPASNAGFDITYNMPNSSSSPNNINTQNLLLNTSWPDVVNYIFFGSTAGYQTVLADEQGAGLTQADTALIAGATKALQLYQQNNKGVYTYTYYQSLLSLPTQFRAPIQTLVALDLQVGNSLVPGQANLTLTNNITYVPNLTTPYIPAPGGQINLVPLLQNMLGVLMWNNVIVNPFSNVSLSGSTYGSNVNITSPVQTIMSDIFDGLLGGMINGSAVESSTVNIMNQIYNLGDQVVGTPQQMAGAQFDMITNAQNLGVQMIETVTNAMQKVSQSYLAAAAGFAAGTAVISAGGTAAALASSAAPFVTTGTVIISATQLAVQLMTLAATMDFSLHLMWLPAFILVMSCLFTAGISFALLLPLTPFILFWAGQMAWILGVIEAMIAAPLILLGMAHPGGHEVIGYATPAVKQLLGIVFRPVLMVLGLLVGIVLTFIVISLSSQAFHVVGMAILGTDNSAGSQLVMDATTRGILACIMVMVYASFIMMAFTKCFSAIYVFPEKVVQWIGGQADRAGQEELQQMTQSVNQTSEKVAQQGGQAMQGITSADKESAQGAQQTAGSGAQGGGQVAGDVRRSKEKGTSTPGKPENG